jgi:signal transduction histidine kinase
MQAVDGGGSGSSRTLSIDGNSYAVLTQRHDGEVRQAVFDERYQLSDRRQLLAALLIAQLVGLVAAAVTGRFLAGRAISPLAQALTRQRQFVADASHELRTPLTRLHTRAQLILRWRGTDLPAEVNAELQRVVDGTRELNEVVDDLLRSARLGASAPVPDRVELAEIVAAVAEAERPRAGEHGLTIVTSYPSQAAGSTAVRGVAPALRRMISALVDNAIRHAPPGGQVRLTVDTDDRGRTVRLVVADDGEGFDPADHERIFDRFARGSASPAGSARQYGLGLALIREVVHGHGGTVTAAGQPGKGAEFTVRLPAAGPEHPVAVRRPAIRPAWLVRLLHATRS